MTTPNVYVPDSMSETQIYQSVLNDLHRGKRVGYPTSIWWHPHPIGAPCGDRCRIVTLEDA